jgi:hypothetical protein
VWFWDEPNDLRELLRKLSLGLLNRPCAYALEMGMVFGVIKTISFKVTLMVLQELASCAPASNGYRDEVLIGNTRHLTTYLYSCRAKAIA